MASEYLSTYKRISEIVPDTHPKHNRKYGPTEKHIDKIAEDIQGMNNEKAKRALSLKLEQIRQIREGARRVKYLLRLWADYWMIVDPKMQQKAVMELELKLIRSSRDWLEQNRRNQLNPEL